MTSSYRPGEWFGIFGDAITVVLPPSEKARVGEIWALVDDGAGFDEVLDALIADGLRDLPGFVLVSEYDGETRVVIRGAARAELEVGDEGVTVEGSSATTWAERSVRDVRSVRIEVADGDAVADLPIEGGLVRVSRADRPAAVSAPSVLPVPPVPPDPTGESTGEQSPEPSDEPTGEPTDEQTPEPMAVGGQVPETTPEQTPQEMPGSDPAAGEPSLTEQAGWAQPSPARVLPPMPGQEPQPAPEPAAPATDHDGHTQAGNWQPGGPAGEHAEHAVLARPVARLVFSSGEVVEVDRAVIVGRAPEARRFTSADQPRLVTVPSPQQEISSTHLEVRPGAGADLGSAVVTDLGSTNGTVLVQPGLPPEDLQPGIAVQLVPGAVIDLGDGVTIQVGRG